MNEHETKSVERLIIAMRECTTLDQLHSLGVGIRLLSLTEENKSLLRDHYISRSDTIKGGPFDPSCLNKKGQKWLKEGVENVNTEHRKV